MEKKQIEVLITSSLSIVLTIISLLFPIFSGTSGTYGNWEVYLYGQMISTIGNFSISEVLSPVVWALLFFFTIFTISGAGLTIMATFIKKRLTMELRIIGGVIILFIYILVFIIGVTFLESHGQEFQFGVSIFIGMFAGFFSIISGLLGRIKKY